MVASILRIGLHGTVSFVTRLHCHALQKWSIVFYQIGKLKRPFAGSLLLSISGIKADLPLNKTEKDVSAFNRNSQNALQTDPSLTFEPNDPRLRSSECLKNAAGLAVDATSAVLSQTVYAVTKIEEEYTKLLDVLVLLLEYQLQVLGHPTEEQRIADLVLETRHEINEVNRRKQDLDLLFASVIKLADATAEVAFATGANYASTSTGERLGSAVREVQRVQVLSQTVETRLKLAEVKSIEVMTKHEEKQRRHSTETNAKITHEQKVNAMDKNVKTENEDTNHKSE